MTGTTRTEPLQLVVLGSAAAGESSNGVSDSHSSAKVVFAATRPSAMTMLRRQGKRPAARVPALVLVDLGYHGEQGWTLLRQIKTDPQLKRIPVIVLGALSTTAERERAYDLQANSYLPRLGDEARFDLLLAQIDQFWLTKVRLPQG